MEKTSVSSRQMKTILRFLTASSIEEACREAKVSKGTFYKWLKQPTFKEEVSRQREALITNAFNRLKASVNKAADEMVKLLDSPRPDIRRGACKDVIDYTIKSIELENIEQRLIRLEKLHLEKAP